jgi:hypothetical protein
MWCWQKICDKSKKIFPSPDKITQPSQGSINSYFGWKLYYDARYGLATEEFSQYYWLSGLMFTPSGFFWREYVQRVARLKSTQTASANSPPPMKLEANLDWGLSWSKKIFDRQQSFLSSGRWRPAPTRTLTSHRTSRHFCLASHRVYTLSRWITPALTGTIRLGNYMPK